MNSFWWQSNGTVLLPIGKYPNYKPFKAKICLAFSAVLLSVWISTCNRPTIRPSHLFPRRLLAIPLASALFRPFRTVRIPASHSKSPIRDHFLRLTTNRSRRRSQFVVFYQHPGRVLGLMYSLRPNAVPGQFVRRCYRRQSLLLLALSRAYSLRPGADIR